MTAPHLSSGVTLSARAPDQGAQPRQDFLDAKRFGDVIVRSAVDAEDLLVPAAPRRQDQDRDGHALLPPLFQPAEAVPCGQPEVQDDCVVLLGVDQEVSARAVRSGIDGVGRFLQRVRELPRQLRFVLDDQNFHSAERFSQETRRPGDTGDQEIRRRY